MPGFPQNATEPSAADRYRHVSFFDASVVRQRVQFSKPPVARLRSVSSPPAEESVAPEVAEFLTWLLQSAGVDSRTYRSAPLARRLAACLRILRVRTIDEARRRLDAQPEQIPSAISALLIGVTAFFRDTTVFADLEQWAMPSLAALQRPLRVLSVACADGSELYSVGMMLARHGLLDRGSLQGIDCRAEAIAKARRGWFDAAQLDGLSPELRDAFFVPDGAGWRVGDRLRQAVFWQRRDALALPLSAEPPWDLVLCRNLAIYLASSAAARLWRSLVGALRPGGVLVVGKAERPDNVRPLLRLAPCIFQKKG